MRDDDPRGPDPRDDYLWSGRGAPDPEVERLERLLGRLRHDPATPLDRSRAPSALDPAVLDLEARRAARDARPRHRVRLLAAAAAALVVIAGAAGARRLARSAWEVVRVDGMVERAGGRGAGAAAGQQRRIERGEVLATRGDAAATIRMGDIGSVELGPRTRVRLERSSPVAHRMELLEGEISAVTSAPPRLFVVETRAARAVDLGCAYVMTADSAGAGTLHVTLGLVSLQLGGRTSYVPAGMIAAMRPGRPAGTPFADDLPAALRDAIALLDTLPRADAAGVAARAAALEGLLAAARPKDVATLWHLVPRTAGTERERVVRRLVELTSLPDGVTAKGLVRGDERMHARLGDYLGLEDARWWRFWRFARAFSW